MLSELEKWWIFSFSFLPFAFGRSFETTKMTSNDLFRSFPPKNKQNQSNKMPLLKNDSMMWNFQLKLISIASFFYDFYTVCAKFQRPLPVFSNGILMLINQNHQPRKKKIRREIHLKQIINAIKSCRRAIWFCKCIWFISLPANKFLFVLKRAVDRERKGEE